MKDIVLGTKLIGDLYPPFIIAELSGNHNGSLEHAIKIVEEAAAAGAHGFKLQTYTPDTLTIDSSYPDFVVSKKGTPWSGESLYNLYEKAQTPWEWHEPLFERARKLGMVPFSTPFDDTAVEFLEKLNVPCFKIASFENSHLELIRRVARTGKPLIISTGLANFNELERTVRTAREEGASDIILLKCTSSYPASPVDSNLRTIPVLKETFHTHVGLSDHTLGLGVPLASIALGACVIEKHLTLSRASGGVDSTFSLEPHELKSLVQESEKAWLALGSVQIGPTAAEQNSLIFRRSIYVVKDIEVGESFTRENVRVIRPGNGLAPYHYSDILGKTSQVSLSRGTALKWSMIQDLP
jgi:pseudaminic acid synthase